MNSGKIRSRRWFTNFAWALLIFNIPVILWGAYVRVSFSGDGCGAHWPFCNGYVVPQHMAKPMIIEFTHRMMTGIDSFGAILLCAWAFQAFSKGQAVRRYAGLSLFFLLVEALLGAGLVLFRKVAHDQSAGRALYLSAHLTNTMLLLGALATTAWLAGNHAEKIDWKRTPRSYFGALFATIVISITGTIAALGDMLFPATSVSAGIAQDFASSSHFLLRLRLFHPVLAICGAAYLVWIAVRAMRAGEGTRLWKSGMVVMMMVLIQIAAGVMNISLLAPIWLQLTHLLIADLLWIATVLLTLERSEVTWTSPAASPERSFDPVAFPIR